MSERESKWINTALFRPRRGPRKAGLRAAGARDQVRRDKGGVTLGEGAEAGPC